MATDLTKLLRRAVRDLSDDQREQFLRECREEANDPEKQVDAWVGAGIVRAAMRKKPRRRSILSKLKE